MTAITAFFTCQLPDDDWHRVIQLFPALSAHNTKRGRTYATAALAYIAAEEAADRAAQKAGGTARKITRPDLPAELDHAYDLSDYSNNNDHDREFFVVDDTPEDDEPDEEPAPPPPAPAKPDRTAHKLAKLKNAAQDKRCAPTTVGRPPQTKEAKQAAAAALRTAQAQPDQEQDPAPIAEQPKPYHWLDHPATVEITVAGHPATVEYLPSRPGSNFQALTFHNARTVSETGFYSHYISAQEIEHIHKTRLDLAKFAHEIADKCHAESLKTQAEHSRYYRKHPDLSRGINVHCVQCTHPEADHWRSGALVLCMTWGCECKSKA